MKKLSAKLIFALPKALGTIGIAICCGLNAAATVRTVNNSTSLPVNPGQYTTISAAITASANGDTILVTGTLAGYSENLTISKKVTLIGAGYYPQYQTPTVLYGMVQFNTGSSGSAIMGFNVCTIWFANAGVRNILIFRDYVSGSICVCGPCYGGGIVMNNQCSFVTIAESVCTYGINLGNINNDTGLVVENCVLYYTSSGCIYNGSTSVSAPQMIIDHNIFLSGSNSTPLPTTYTYALQTANAIVSNNIFYGIVPIDTNNSSSYGNNTFYNNLTYAGTTIKALPWGSNGGTGNINNSNPMFTSSSIFPNTSAPYFDLKNSNFRPLTGSPVINAALDFTNIGPTGGLYPIYTSSVPWLTGEPPVPEVESAIFTSGTAVPIGTPINIQVKAKKIN